MCDGWRCCFSAAQSFPERQGLRPAAFGYLCRILSNFYLWWFITLQSAFFYTRGSGSVFSLYLSLYPRSLDGIPAALFFLVMVLLKHQEMHFKVRHFWQSCFVLLCSHSPQDYSLVSFQRPLVTDESHLAMRVPIMVRLNPSLAQQSSHHFVNHQKKYKSDFPLSTTSAGKVLSFFLLSDTV